MCWGDNACLLGLCQNCCTFVRPGWAKQKQSEANTRLGKLRPSRMKRKVDAVSSKMANMSVKLTLIPTSYPGSGVETAA